MAFIDRIIFLYSKFAIRTLLFWWKKKIKIKREKKIRLNRKKDKKKEQDNSSREKKYIIWKQIDLIFHFMFVREKFFKIHLIFILKFLFIIY